MTTQTHSTLSDLRDHAEGEYQFRNIRNGNRIITKETAGYSSMTSYLEKHTLHYFTFSQNSEKPVEAIIHHLPRDTPAEDISTGLEDFGFNVYIVRQMAAT
jgi:hypothetical protein